MKKPRVFSPETKLSTVKRMLSGEDVSALARELKLRRTFIYRWKERYRKGGAAAFHARAGRPAKSRAGGDDLRSKPVDDLESARQRIAQLERKIGQQQLELDFFRQALRQVGAKR